VRALDANVPIYDVQTMDDVIFRAVGTDRLLSGVLMTFFARHNGAAPGETLGRST
jgi:hypothetical protein